MDEVTGLWKDLELIFSCSTVSQSSSMVGNTIRRTSSMISRGGLATIIRSMRCYSPCICPTISSVSKRSVPASRSSFPPRAERNLALKPSNQPCQKGWVAARSVRQLYDAGVPFATGVASGGVRA